MLKYMVVFAGALVVLAAADEVQARGLRRSRGGSCPNGQCYATIPAAPAKAVAVADQLEAPVLAEAAVAAPIAATVAAPVEPAATYAVTTTFAPQANRFASRVRFFRRR